LVGNKKAKRSCARGVDWFMDQLAIKKARKSFARGVDRLFDQLAPLAKLFLLLLTN